MFPEEEITLGIQQLKLFNDGEEEYDVVTSTEAEAGDDAGLEAEIEEADREAEGTLNQPLTELPLV